VPPSLEGRAGTDKNEVTERHRSKGGLLSPRLTRNRLLQTQVRGKEGAHSDGKEGNRSTLLVAASCRRKLLQESKKFEKEKKGKEDSVIPLGKTSVEALITKRIKSRKEELKRSEDWISRKVVGVDP